MQEPKVESESESESESELEHLRAQAAELQIAGHQLVSTQAQMQSLLHNASDAIIMFEEDGTVRSFNRVAENIFDYMEIEILGQTVEKLFALPSELEGKDVPAFLDAYIKETPDQYEAPLKAFSRNGDELLLEVSIAAIEKQDLLLFDDEGIDDSVASAEYEAFMAIFHNITERKHIDDELRKHQENLEMLVEEQTREIVSAKNAAEQANQSKSAFLANMSHELRTPMHAILSFSEFGIQKIDKAPPEKLLQYFERIKTSGSRLLMMINELLDLSKAEAGKLEYDFRAADFVGLIENILEENEALFQQKQLQVSFKHDGVDYASVEMDAERIGQVVRNLLSNASKFTPAGKNICVSLQEVSFNEQSAVKCSVMDEGMGVPVDELHALFEKFVQTSNNKKVKGGTGLGLAISREIVNAHHGEISAINNIDVGANFFFFIPMKQAN